MKIWVSKVTGDIGRRRLPSIRKHSAASNFEYQFKEIAKARCRQIYGLFVSCSQFGSNDSTGTEGHGLGHSTRDGPKYIISGLVQKDVQICSILSLGSGLLTPSTRLWPVQTLYCV